MDYTSSGGYATDPSTGQRMHLQAQAVPTAVSDVDMNGLIWEILAAIKASGLVPAAFDKAVPATYGQLRDAISIAVRLQSAAYANAGGGADALTGIYAPVVPALVNGLTLYVRTATANSTTAPTFSPNGLAAKQIVKGNGLPLVAGDIAGGGHWIELQYDAPLDKWVLLNPAFGIKSPPVLSSLGVSGYRSFPSFPGDPNPLILQWGAGSFAYTTGIQTVDISFPIAYPTACRAVGSSNYGVSASGGGHRFSVESFTQSKFTAGFSSPVAQSGGYSWVSVGN